MDHDTVTQILHECCGMRVWHGVAGINDELASFPPKKVALVTAKGPSAISARRPRNVANTHTFGEMPGCSAGTCTAAYRLIQKAISCAPS